MVAQLQDVAAHMLAAGNDEGEPTVSDLRFRNIDVDPGDPVEDWGFEGLLSAVDRGGIRDRQKVVAAFLRDPWGPGSHS